MILMHGMGVGADRRSMDSTAQLYARAGIEVITIDAPFMRPENQRTWIAGTPLTFTEQDQDEMVQLVIDLRRAVDLLVSRGEIDPDRLAYMGYSFGGTTGGLLAGIEDRIKAYVLVVGDGGLVSHLTGNDDLSSYPKGIFFRMTPDQQQTWLEAMWPVESLHYVGQAAPAALLFQNGTTDINVPPGDAIRYQEAGSEPKTVIWYEGSHTGIYSPQFWVDQSTWLHQQVGIKSMVLKPQFNQSLVWGDRLITLWLVCTVLAFMVLIWDLVKNTPASWGERILWGLGCLVLGPVGLAGYWLTFRDNSYCAQHQLIPGWCRATGSSIWSVSGVIIGLAIALEIQLRFQVNSYLVLLYILLPFLGSLLSFQFARLVSRGDHSFNRFYKRNFLGELISTNSILLVAMPLMSVLTQLYIHQFPFSINSISPAVWVVFNLVGIVSLLVSVPVQMVLIRLGYVRYLDQTSEAAPVKRSVFKRVGEALACLVIALSMFLAGLGLSLAFQEVLLKTFFMTQS